MHWNKDAEQDAAWNAEGVVSEVGVNRSASMSLCVLRRMFPEGGGEHSMFDFPAAFDSACHHER
jgi:hypothetical protein